MSKKPELDRRPKYDCEACGRHQSRFDRAERDQNGKPMRYWYRCEACGHQRSIYEPGRNGPAT